MTPTSIVYDARHGTELDLYTPTQPAEPQPAQDVPLVILFHGGGMTAGAKKDLFTSTDLIGESPALHPAFLH